MKEVSILEANKNKDNQLVQVSNTSDLGITSVIIYSMIFLYAYMNAYYKKNSKLGLSIIPGKEGFTITDAMFHSEKVGVSVLLALFISTTLYILYKQNFHKHILGIINMIIIVSFSVILVGFMYIGTNQVFMHTAMAAAMFIGGQMFAFCALTLYSESYPDDNIEEMSTNVYALTALFVLIIFLIGLGGYWVYNSNNKKKLRKSMSSRFLWDITAIVELLHIGFFGVLLYIISIYPALKE